MSDCASSERSNKPFTDTVHATSRSLSKAPVGLQSLGYHRWDASTSEADHDTPPTGQLWYTLPPRLFAHKASLRCFVLVLTKATRNTTPTANRFKRSLRTTGDVQPTVRICPAFTISTGYLADSHLAGQAPCWDASS
jgi:hypothetical protein